MAKKQKKQQKQPKKKKAEEPKSEITSPKDLFKKPEVAIEEQKDSILKEPITEPELEEPEETTEPKITEKEELAEPQLPDKKEEYYNFSKMLHSTIINIAKINVDGDQKQILDDSGAMVFQKWDKWQLIEKYGVETTYLMAWGNIIQANYFNKKAEEPEEKEEAKNPIEDEPEEKKEGFSNTIARL